MRKVFYLPTHMRERILNFRKRHEMMEEQIAIVRLLDAGLNAEENKVLPMKQVADTSVGGGHEIYPRTWIDEWQKVWGSFYRMNERI